MATVSEIHVGDVGTRFIITLVDGTTPVDISPANSITFIFKKPGGTVVEKTGTFDTNGTDGKVLYTVEPGLLNEYGKWLYQIKVVIGSQIWSSDIGCITVFKNLN